jgi:hypothetical protein
MYNKRVHCERQAQITLLVDYSYTIVFGYLSSVIVFINQGESSGVYFKHLAWIYFCRSISWALRNPEEDFGQITELEAFQTV